MMFWIFAAVLTALATIALLWPLARGGRDAARADHDIEVYSDQLAELDRDLKAGLIDATEADYARAEISRRLLRAGEGARQARGPSKTLRNAARVAVLVCVPGAAMGAYLATGNPDMPDQPLASRNVAPPAAPGGGVAELIAQAEAHLAENPDDGRGWDVLAPIYLRLGRLEEARTAFSNAIRLLGPSAERQSGYGEVLTAMAGGVVTREARVAFQSAREMAPANPKAAFYLALALQQEGSEEHALTAFENLARRSPPDAPWMAAVNARIGELGGGGLPDITASGLPALSLLPETGGVFAAEEETIAAVTGTPVSPDAPSEDQIAAMAAMSATDRAAAIEGMVSGLDRRLREEPEDLKGWLRLVRSYGVLGDGEKAHDALERALKIFPRETDGGKALLTVARQSGIDVAAEDAE